MANSHNDGNPSQSVVQLESHEESWLSGTPAVGLWIIVSNLNPCSGYDSLAANRSKKRFLRLVLRASDQKENKNRCVTEGRGDDRMGEGEA